MTTTRRPVISVRKNLFVKKIQCCSYCRNNHSLQEKKKKKVEDSKNKQLKGDDNITTTTAAIVSREIRLHDFVCLLINFHGGGKDRETDNVKNRPVRQ